MTILFLQNIFEKSINGEWGNEDSGKGQATAVIRTSNFLNSGRLNLDNIVCREIDKDKNSGKILRTGDIIIEKSGGSSNQPVGRVVYFDVTDQDYFTNNFTSILRVKPGYNSKYIFYLMKYLYDTKKVLKFQNQTTGIINLKLADYLNKTKVNIEAIENQNTIVDILDRLEYQIINRNKQLSELSNLVKSRFNEMFGDPVFNEMRWRRCKLKDISVEKLAYGSGASAIDFSGLRYIRITDIDECGNLKIDKKSPSHYDEKYLLNTGDILFARSGATVGKTFLYSKEKYGPAQYAGYLIRLIPNLSLVNPVFVYHFTNTKFYNDFITKVQNTVAQPNINAKQYGELDFILPPLSLQNEFADFVAQVDKSQFACQIVIKLWRNSLKSSII